MSIRTKIVFGSLIFFIFGILIVLWLNVAVPPAAVMVFLFPYTFMPIIIWYFMVPVSSFLVIVYLIGRFFKDVRSVWFFLGATLMSLVFAGQSLEQISILYYLNVGRWLPLQVEGYSFPAIYTFSVFKSIFFTTFFAILGYLDSIEPLSKIAVAFSRFRDKKQKRLTDFF